MKAMIFAAGLGTRLKPLTDSTPKALLPINGKPMLEHVILKLKDAGFHQIAINIHHLGDQIINFLAANNNFGIQIHISDERDYLLDTGGGIKHATAFLQGNEPFLIHNVDILSDIDLRALYNHHAETNPLATLLVISSGTSAIRPSAASPMYSQTSRANERSSRGAWAPVRLSVVYVHPSSFPGLPPLLPLL